MDNIIDLINDIPKILQYFVSGFIFLKLFCFFTSKENMDVSFYTIWSVTISFVLLSIVKTINAIPCIQLSLSLWAEVLICVLLAVVLSYFTYKIYVSKPLSKVVNKATNKSVNSDIWRDIVDYDKGTIFKIFLKDSNIIYVGKILLHEEKGNDSWFVFKEYICSYNDSGAEFDSKTQDFPTVVAISLSEIERFELFYHKDTKLFG